MQLQDVLYSQGFGTRRICAGLVQHGHVEIQLSDGTYMQPCLEPSREVDVQDFQFKVQGVVWPYRAKAYVMLHKPVGFECSQKTLGLPQCLYLVACSFAAASSQGGCGRSSGDWSAGSRYHRIVVTQR